MCAHRSSCTDATGCGDTSSKARTRAVVMEIWSRLKAAIVAAIHRLQNRMEFRRHVLAAVADGRLTSGERNRLAALREDLGITRKEVNRVGAEAYLAAYRDAAADGHISREEEAELDDIQAYFGISDSAIARSKSELLRFRLLRRISEGELPEVEASGLGLQRRETPHWVEPASLLEERVIRREYVGRSAGMSVRIAKGLTYRVGAQRGRMVNTTDIVAVSTGNLVITNQRVVFQGDAKGFSIRLDRMLDAELYADGLRVMDASGKPRVLKLSSTRNIDILGAVLSRVIANRQA